MKDIINFKKHFCEEDNLLTFKRWRCGIISGIDCNFKYVEDYSEYAKNMTTTFLFQSDYRLYRIEMYECGRQVIDFLNAHYMYSDGGEEHKLLNILHHNETINGLNEHQSISSFNYRQQRVFDSDLHTFEFIEYINRNHFRYIRPEILIDIDFRDYLDDCFDNGVGYLAYLNFDCLLRYFKLSEKMKKKMSNSIILKADFLNKEKFNLFINKLNKQIYVSTSKQ